VQPWRSPGDNALNKALLIASQRAKKKCLGILKRTFSMYEGAFPGLEEEPTTVVRGLRNGNSTQDLHWLV
jgi:hypothetical protein